MFQLQKIGRKTILTCHSTEFGRCGCLECFDFVISTLSDKQETLTSMDKQLGSERSSKKGEMGREWKKGGKRSKSKGTADEEGRGKEMKDVTVATMRIASSQCLVDSVMK